MNLAGDDPQFEPLEPAAEPPAEPESENTRDLDQEDDTDGR